MKEQSGTEIITLNVAYNTKKKKKKKKKKKREEEEEKRKRRRNLWRFLKYLGR